MLEDICAYRPNLALEIDLPACCPTFHNSHRILRRLKKIIIEHAHIDHFAMLDCICNQYPITLILGTERCLQELLGYPAMLGQIAKLTLRSSTAKKEDIVWLDTSEMVPKLRKLKIQMRYQPPELTNCSFMHFDLIFLEEDWFKDHYSIDSYDE